MVTRDQISAGGVAFRKVEGVIQVALVRVGEHARWQLPKGIVDRGESPETTAIREVREEAGIETELLAPLDTIEYWYVSTERGRKVRFRKFVHFYLLAYRGGNVADHDDEVLEARWVALDGAMAKLAFKNERTVLEHATERIASLEVG